MPTVRRSKTVSAPPDRVWQVVADPHHMPRWWPLVKRMEGVSGDEFTQVLTTRKGRSVRADFRVLASEPPDSGDGSAGRRVWEQETEGTPFERVLGEAITEIVVEPAGGATRVTISLTQRLRGYSRTGGFMLRRATRKRLGDALEGLEELFRA
ncbi:MAG TPA: SRPBCC family protein [Solirubrobacteraceae bacterium]|nr:SRPBCC family protein [Solirubrobacteraceae bacterium]